jgi:pimeloyl-ACP methyl ester carboxylesterase
VEKNLRRLYRQRTLQQNPRTQLEEWLVSELLLDRAFVRLEHGRLHYRERAATAEGAELPPLLLLHASPNCSRSLAPIMLAEGSGRRLLALDTPGNGDSDPLAAAAPEMSDYADAVEAFCVALALDRVDIFGSHTGAHIGVEMAGRWPGRVRCVAVDGLLRLSDAERQEYLDTYAPHRTPDEIGSQFHWVWQYVRDQMIFFPHFKKDRAHLRAGGIFDPQFLHQMALDVLRALPTYHLAYQAVFRHDVAAALSAADCPLRWLDTGEGYLDAGMQLLRERAPQGSVVSVAHDPAAFAAAIADFCRELG